MVANSTCTSPNSDRPGPRDSSRRLASPRRAAGNRPYSPSYAARTTVPAAACDPVRRRAPVPSASSQPSWRPPARATLGPQLACADVASSVGLEFTGDYGPVLPAPDAYGTLMQENMGNGAAVGDYDGDGYLDVLLLGQAGHQTKLFRNDPAPDGGRRYTDVTDAAGLGGITSNARVAQFVDLSGSGRPDLVIAADYIPGRPRWALADPAQQRGRHVHGRDRRLRVRSRGLHRGRHDLRRLRRHGPPEHLPQLLDRGARRRPGPGSRQGRIPGAEPPLPEPR